LKILVSVKALSRKKSRGVLGGESHKRGEFSRYNLLNLKGKQKTSPFKNPSGFVFKLEDTKPVSSS
jgi:hypothetical protein